MCGSMYSAAQRTRDQSWRSCLRVEWTTLCRNWGAHFVAHLLPTRATVSSRGTHRSRGAIADHLRHLITSKRVK